MAMMGVADTNFQCANGFHTAATEPLIAISPRPGWVSHRQSKRRRRDHGAKRLALPIKRKKHTDSCVVSRGINVVGCSFKSGKLIVNYVRSCDCSNVPTHFLSFCVPQFNQQLRRQNHHPLESEFCCCMAADSLLYRIIRYSSVITQVKFK
jgi:hypothetical protein